MMYIGFLPVLQGLISLIIALYSLNGYLKLRSDTLKYFSIAFALLFLDFLLEAASQFIELGIWGSYSISALRMFGYISLALSHIISVRREVAGGMPIISIASVAMRSIGLYFLLYAAVETTLFSIRKGCKVALASSLALYLIFVGEFMDVAMLAGIPPILPGLIRFAGFALLISPLFLILKPVRGRG